MVPVMVQVVAAPVVAVINDIYCFASFNSRWAFAHLLFLQNRTSIPELPSSKTTNKNGNL